MGRWIVILGVVVVLTGCAATPEPVKLSRQQHESFANSFVGLERCIQQGDISPELGALGNRYLSAELVKYSYYPFAFQKWVDRAREEITTVDARHCNQSASAIAGRKQEIDIHNAWVDQNRQDLQNTINQINSNRPVICNTVGTYTMCQ